MSDLAKAIFQPRQGRKKVAHGVSRGEADAFRFSPGRGVRKDGSFSNSPARVFLRPCRGFSLGRCSPTAHAVGYFLAPLPGLGTDASK